MNSFTHEALASNTTSSIGAVWPPIEASNERLRGFYPSVIASPADINEFTDNFEAERQKLPELGVDRLTIRAVTDLASLQLLEASGVQVEAALPLAYSDHVIAYAAWNAPGRQVPADIIATHANALHAATHPSRPDSPVDLARYSSGIIDRATDNRARRVYAGQFERLYAAFNYDRSEVELLLNNPHNTICFLRDGERIVSTAMAETADIDVEGYGRIQIAEVTEAITDPDLRGNGLYKAVSRLLVDHMVAGGDYMFDAIYGESNLAMPGVLLAAHRNGRRFSYYDQQRFRLHSPSFGMLLQNFHVADGKETRRYNDFALSYIPLGDQV